MNGELNQYVKQVEFLGQALGNNYEVVLYDIEDSKGTIAAIENDFGNNPSDNNRFIAEVLKSRKAKKRDYICSYPRTTSNGKIIKSSVFIIRNIEEDIIGALCISIKCDTLLRVKSMIESVLQFNPYEIDDNIDSDEIQDSKFAQPTLESIQQMVEEFGVNPERMSQDERKEIMCDLFDTGVFNLKGAVAKTAEALKISEPSVYRYLNKIKKARD
jgi:predicted transcriptional regulator YheO